MSVGEVKHIYTAKDHENFIQIVEEEILLVMHARVAAVGPRHHISECRP